MTVDWIRSLRCIRRSQRRVENRIRTGASIDRLDHQRVRRTASRVDVVARRVTKDDVPRLIDREFGAALKAAGHFAVGVEPVDEVGLAIRVFAGDVLPRHADDAGDEDEARVTNVAVVVLRVEVGEQRVRYEVAVTVLHRLTGQAIDVTLDRLKKIDAEAVLLVPAAKIDLVLFGRERILLAVHVLVALVLGCIAACTRALPTRTAARAVRIHRA